MHSFASDPLSIKEQNVKAGVAINPATPVSAIEPILSDVDLVLMMTVNPGFGGQSLIPSTLPKVQQVAQLLEEKRLSHVEIEVDGGVNQKNAAESIQHGATVLVAGSAIFNQRRSKKALKLSNNNGVIFVMRKKRVVVVAGGEFTIQGYAAYSSEHDWIIAADGGASQTHKAWGMAERIGWRYGYP